VEIGESSESETSECSGRGGADAYFSKEGDKSWVGLTIDPRQENLRRQTSRPRFRQKAKRKVGGRLLLMRLMMVVLMSHGAAVIASDDGWQLEKVARDDKLKAAKG
jgi:hypothetical protein